MKGVHESRRPGKGRTAALVVIGLGLIMIITSLILEASNYPWGLLFGTATQNEETLPDPSPLVLDAEDAGAEIVFNPEETTTPSTTDPSQAPSVNVGDAATLPGDEQDTAEAPKTPTYVVLGAFKIPVLSVSQNLLEGSGKQMKYGVGHVTGTAAPGQGGNCVVAGHRPYPFRYLDKLVAGDSVIIKTGDVTYTYTVYESFEVLPTEVWVLNSVDGEAYALTIITCTPYMVSSHRLIVRARLTDVNGLTPEEYYGVEPTPVTSPETTDDAAASDAAATETASAGTSAAETDAAQTGDVSPSSVPEGEPSAEDTGTESAVASESQGEATVALTSESP